MDDGLAPYANGNAEGGLTMAKHECCDCKWMHTFTDNSGRSISICIFDQAENYLQEVGYCTEDCELDEFAEELWGVDNG